MKNVKHSLAVADIYFKYLPKKFIYEPRDKFKHEGKPLKWAPDCVFILERNGKEVLVCFEMQLSELTGKSGWPGKWWKYNVFFGNDYYKKASYQQWFEKPRKPNVIVISNQSPELIKKGFNTIDGKELIIRASL